jgi:hypothetical protein
MANVYDLVEYKTQRIEFTPAMHVGSTWDAFARNESSLNCDPNIAASTNLVTFGNYMSHSPT